MYQSGRMAVPQLTPRATRPVTIRPSGNVIMTAVPGARKVVFIKSYYTIGQQQAERVGGRIAATPAAHDHGQIAQFAPQDGDAVGGVAALERRQT